MGKRSLQIWGFLMTVLGWIFVACSIAMEGWKITAIGGMGGSAVVKVAWYWSSLWRACFTDSAAVTNCYDFPVLWSVENHIQVVRGLLMGALALGMLGFVLSLMGMECTFIGGQDRDKHRKVFTGGFCHIVSGLLSSSGYAVYARYVSAEFFNPTFDGLRFDLGTPLFLGWVGSAVQITGGVLYLVSVHALLCQSDSHVAIPEIPESGKTRQASNTSSSSVVESSAKRKASNEVPLKHTRSSVPSVYSKSRTKRGERNAFLKRSYI